MHQIKRLFFMAAALVTLLVASCGTVSSGSSPDAGGACGPLEPPANGDVAVPINQVGATATYSCSNGYNLVGAAARSCLADGTWSGTTPACEPVDCGALVNPANGEVAFEGTTFGATATYTCGDGFSPVGETMRTCQADGTWSGGEPLCIRACPCFGPAGLDAIEADIAGGGSETCVVDNMGGGTTITALISSQNRRRFVASALFNTSLPDTQLACEFGCLDDTPDDGVDQCANLPAFRQTRSISAEEHALCREQIAMRCAN